METKEKQQWEELKNIKQKNKGNQPEENGIKPIIKEIKKISTEWQEKDTGEIKKIKKGRPILNLIGQTFYGWKIIEHSGIIRKLSHWKCLCKCGNIKIISGTNLKNGTSKCCGCKRNGKIKDLTGQKFNRWTVIEFAERKYKETWWNCKCECGTIKKVRGNSLKNNTSKSCGCLRIEMATQTHRLEKGQTGLNFLIQSYKQNAKKFNREIKLSREQFKEITSSNCYYCGIKPKQIIKLSSKTRSDECVEWSKYVYNGIDRIDNDKDYTVENCVSCCKICNVSKNNMTLKEFDEWIKRLYSNRFNILNVRNK